MVEAGPYIEYCGQVYICLDYACLFLFAGLLAAAFCWLCMTRILLQPAPGSKECNTD